MLHFRRGFAAVLLAGLLVAPAAARDAEIERRIRARLGVGRIALEKFQVSVRNGVATLSGATRTAQRKALATRIARQAGAADVRNEIRILAIGPVRPAQIVR